MENQGIPTHVVGELCTLGVVMNKYILVAFAVMAMTFYELSGGSEFEPGETSLVIFAEPKPMVEKTDERPAIVARADTSIRPLTDIAPARAVIEPAVSNASVVVTPVALEPETIAVTPEQPELDIQDVAVQQEPSMDLRFVDGDRVNLRAGPGTDFAVVGKLVRNDLVEVLSDDGNGWLHLRNAATGDEGYVADWLVTAAN